MKKISLFFVCLTFCYTTFATHIIGGEMSYICLGSDNYEITLKLYRDCYNGQAPYDNPTNIFVFDATGLIVQTLPISFNSSDTLNAQTNCAAFIPYICAE